MTQLIAGLSLAAGWAALADTPAQTETPAAEVFSRRQADWRNGPVVYQVIVDRFAPSTRLEEKMPLYASPRVLKKWTDPAKGGKKLDDVGVWSHEIEFWGGDLASTRGKVGYLKDLGIDVLYLNPIHDAFTNHKYDARDFFKVSPEYGTRQDVKLLADDVHAAQMKLVLDGVFNHMGRRAHWFTDARDNSASQYRDYFVFGQQFKTGYRAWANVVNLPELNLENAQLRARLWNDADSVVQGYLRQEDIDGWRLDVAYDIGPTYLAELTAAAHKAKPGSLVVGEIWAHPEQWMPAVDGLLNFHAREIILRAATGRVSPKQAQGMLDVMVQDTGVENLLKCWLLLDNHDTERLATLVPDPGERKVAQLLQFTLPGVPNLYYGSELGMAGGADPANRGPMNWDLVTPDNPDLLWTKQLIALRKELPALRIGDIRFSPSEKLIAFSRYTDQAKQTVIVVINPGEEDVREVISPRVSSLMSHSRVVDVLDASETQIFCGLLDVTVPAKSARIYRVKPIPPDQYDPYKRLP
jgi:glycosidase